MALPIVGKFFYKTYRDRKFANLATHSFQQPSDEMLAMLSEPGYRDILDIQKHDFNLADIFRRDGEKPGELGNRKKAEVEKKDDGQIWKKIKSIFKKKK